MTFGSFPVSVLRCRRFISRIPLMCVAAILLAALPGCSTKPSDRALVFVTPAEGEQLVQGQKRLLGIGNSKGGVWIDARTPQAYQAEHIPGAINVPFERVTQEYDRLKDYSTIIVYGEEYNDARALGMSKRLMALGHKDVRTLTGGLRAWKTANLPTSKGSDAAGVN